MTCRHAGSVGGSSVTCAHWARCHGGSWWWSTAGRPRSRPATTRAAGRFSGIVQRFSTTTRSAPSSAASSSLGGRRRASAPTARPGRRWSTGPVAGHRAHRPARARRAPAPRWRPPPTRRRDARAGTTRRRPRARRHATDRRGAHRCRAAGARGGVARRTPPAGFCVPNATTYPWQWLWDSCFHAVVWAHLGDERAVRRARAARCRRRTTTASCPTCATAPVRIPHEALWGRRRRVDDHPAADVRPRRRRARPARARARRRAGRAGPARAGVPPAPAAPHRGGPGGALPPVGVGLRRQPPLGRHRARRAHPGGVVRAEGRAGRDRSSGRRAARRSTTRRSRSARSGFSALVAWNALELATRHGRRAPRGRGRASWRTRSTLAGTPTWSTWVDDGPTAAGSGRIRTLDALLPSLLHPRPEVFDALARPGGLRRAVRPARRPRRRADLRAGDVLARAGVAAAHLPAVARRHQLGFGGRGLGAGEVDASPARSARGSRSTGWPTPARRSARCPRPGRPSRCAMRSGR